MGGSGLRLEMVEVDNGGSEELNFILGKGIGGGRERQRKKTWRCEGSVAFLFRAWESASHLGGRQF